MFQTYLDNLFDFKQHQRCFCCLALVVPHLPRVMRPALVARPLDDSCETKQHTGKRRQNRDGKGQKETDAVQCT